MAKHSNMIYALKEGTLTTIADVPSGLACGCVCPACGASLAARKGEQQSHYFAHPKGRNCGLGYEASLHVAIREILSKSKKIIIPPIYLNFPDSYKGAELISEEKEIAIDRVELEKHFDDSFPKAVVYAENMQLCIELLFKRPKEDKIKPAETQNADISIIEIDLIGIEGGGSVNVLSEILLCHNEKKTWKSNSLANQWQKAFRDASDQMDITVHGFAWHANNCPIGARYWKGKPYANFTDDCLYCEYCISYKDFLCSGRRRISTIKDFSISEEARIRENNAKRAQKKAISITNGRCPWCGGRLVERTGAYGRFWGCSGYPHCRFTASINETL